MSPHSSISSIEAAVLQYAWRQHGLVKTAQLVALGLTRNGIGTWCRHGRLIRVHRGVYAVGRFAQTPVERAAAAVLACGDGALLSHQSALSLWALIPGWHEPFHVTVPNDRRRPGIIVHRTPGLTPTDRRQTLGIWITSAARAILDSAPDLPGRQLARAVADARRSGLARRAALDDVLTRFPRHPGCAPLMRVLDGDYNPTRSDFEDDFPNFCVRYDLPTPTLNVWIAGHEVDAVFSAEKVIVELDGWNFHQDRPVFENDRDRDADTLAAGFVTVRITPDRLYGTPDREAARLNAILARRRDETAANPASDSGRRRG